MKELLAGEATERGGDVYKRQSYESGTFTAKVLEVSDYPISAQMYMGEGKIGRAHV